MRTPKILGRRLQVVGLSLGLALLSAPSLVASDCDPDFRGKDRITKQDVMQWQQVLTSSGILSAALLEKDITFTAYVARAGEKNLLGVVVQKVEENLARAAFETQFRAAKGDEIILGFKNGTPVTFVTTKAANSAQAGTFSGKLNMSASWEAEVSDADITEYRDALTTRLIDAIRITAASGQIDRAVPEKNGERLRQKFGCFFRSLEYAGVTGPSVHQSDGEAGTVRRPSSSSPLEAAVRSTANCRANFTVHGSMVRGTSYDTYDEYPAVEYTTGLADAEAAMARAGLAIESRERAAGTIIAVGKDARGKDVRYQFTVVPTSAGMRVTIARDLRVGKHGADDAIRDEMCKVLSAIAEVTARSEPPRTSPPVTANPPVPTSARTVKSDAKDGASDEHDAEERLRRLDELFKKGLITEDEYKKKRAQILSSL